MTKRVSHERFTQTAVKILQAITRASEIGLEPTERPSEEQLLEFIHEAKRVHIGEIECLSQLDQLEKEHDRLKAELETARQEIKGLQAGLNLAVYESDELRKKVNGLPTWLNEKMFTELDPTALAALSTSKQWVLLVSPRADWLSWFTLAETIMRFTVVGIPNKHGWGLIAGTWTPETRTSQP